METQVGAGVGAEVRAEVEVESCGLTQFQL